MASVEDFIWVPSNKLATPDPLARACVVFRDKWWVADRGALAFHVDDDGVGAMCSPDKMVALSQCPDGTTAVFQRLVFVTLDAEGITIGARIRLPQ